MTAQPLAVEKHCPKCGSARVHRSHRRSALTRWFCAIGGEIRRCHDCRSRLAWFGSVRFSLPKEDYLAGERMTSLAMVTTFVACFLLIWWMISRLSALAG
jgi:predicted RNA-binding Zn-ribbon protein involved in translation (DUF1610 family)